MVSSLLTQMPMPVKLGVPVAAALLAAACGSSTSSGSAASSAPAAGSTGSGSAAAASGTVIKTTAGSTDAFLTDSSGRTLYLFAKDGHNMSSCTGACASAWPPVTAKGSVTGSGSVKASDLGTITLSDGTKQVTYDGHPLYTYAGDSGAGQTNGQGSDNFGAKWWLVSPSGAQITSADKASSSSGSGGGAPAAPASTPASSGNAGGGWS
jgi:predicted lipoprotein with Yx(FWY)xxD motif